MISKNGSWAVEIVFPEVWIKPGKVLCKQTGKIGGPEAAHRLASVNLHAGERCHRSGFSSRRLQGRDATHTAQNRKHRGSTILQMLLLGHGMACQMTLRHNSKRRRPTHGPTLAD